jgi:galactokinase
MGSHTDYNQGYVLTLPIHRQTMIAAAPRADRKVALASLDLEGECIFSLDAIEFDEDVQWSNYVRGVAEVFQAEGFPLNGFDGLIHSTVPLGSGLSSSAALEVAAARLFQALNAGGEGAKFELDAVRLALLCQKAENQFVGMNCGILDQYTSSVGQVGNALLLDCRSLESRTIPIDPGVSIVICDTRTKRELTGSEYADRRAQCEKGAAMLARQHAAIQSLRDASLSQLNASQDQLPAVIYKRCKFILEENQRVLELAEALVNGNEAQISRLTKASFEGARDLYEIVIPEMERMLDCITSSPGSIGGRQAGAGFGGCLVAFVEKGREAEFSNSVMEAFYEHTGITAQVFPV